MVGQALPPVLAAFLADREFAMLINDTNIGSVVTIKLPDADLADLGGRIQFSLRYELHHPPYGPVIRFVLGVADRADSHLWLETFCNPADPVQVSEFRDLVGRDRLRVLFYGSDLTLRFSKLVPQAPDDVRMRIVDEAIARLIRMDPDDVDFDRAKAKVQADNPIDLTFPEPT